MHNNASNCLESTFSDTMAVCPQCLLNVSATAESTGIHPRFLEECMSLNTSVFCTTVSLCVCVLVCMCVRACVCVLISAIQRVVQVKGQDEICI